MKKFAVITTAAAVFCAAPILMAQCGSKSRSAGSHTSAKTYAHTISNKQSSDIVETALASGQFTTLTTALGKAGLVKALQGHGPFTVFAPTDEAFAKLPAGTVDMLLKPENRGKLTAILTYHVAKGNLDAKHVTAKTGVTTLNGQRLNFSTNNGVRVGNSEVIKADIKTSNGIIHVIDSVLLPAEENIVQLAAQAGQFQTLLAAAKAANLDGVLSGDGPFTVFAPTDDAFSKLPSNTVNDLLKPQNRQKLANILKLHVVEGRVSADDAVSVRAAHAVNGDDLTFKLDNGSLKVNGAGIVATDLQAQNGVIHVIDTVLLPQ